MDQPLATTPLDRWSRALGARMVPFAGYAMPVQYQGVLAEHRACRERAALFDVSHMGQARLAGPGGAAALERLVCGDIAGLKPGRQRYTLLTNEAGGILDDLMVANLGEALFLVVNAANKAADFAHIAAALPAGLRLEPLPGRALIALQGPRAAEILARFAAGAATMAFLGVARLEIQGAEAIVSRSGYTGEDGFEISLPAEAAEPFARALAEDHGVTPAGLGARDSLRLEAGLCLHGADIDAATDPIEAALGWTIGKRRRMAWDFPGGEAIRATQDAGPARLRVGIAPEGRAPARAGTEIRTAAGEPVGTVTSGGFSPTLDRPIAMGYVRRDHAADGTELALLVRGRPLSARIVPLPFVPHRYPSRSAAS